MDHAEVQAWLAEVSVWNLDREKGVLFVGSADRVLIVGQAPAKGNNGAPALSGRSGARLRKLLSCADDVEFRAQFDVFNILPKWPGKAGKGDRFPMATAKAIAKRVRFRAERVLVLGKAAEAFGVDVWFQWSPAEPTTRICAVPHPSGVNRWWNEPNNMALASDFFVQMRAGHELC